MLGVSTALVGSAIGGVMGISTRDTLAQIAAGTLQSTQPWQVTAIHIIIPIAAVLGGSFMAFCGYEVYCGKSAVNEEPSAESQAHSHKDKSSMQGPIMLITASSTVTLGVGMGIGVAIGQTVEQTTTQQMEAIAISAGVIAALAAVAFITGHVLAERSKGA